MFNCTYCEAENLSEEEFKLEHNRRKHALQWITGRLAASLIVPKDALLLLLQVEQDLPESGVISPLRYGVDGPE